MNRKLITSGLLAGLVAGSGAGLVLQSSGLAGASSASSGLPAVVVQTDDTTGDDTTGSTDDATDRAAERTARLSEILQPLVDDGTLSAEQRDAVIAAFEAAGPLGGRGGPGHHGRGDGRGEGRGDGFGRGAGLETAAEALGMTTDDLRTALESGQTLAEIATAEGVEVQSVIDALVLAAGTHLSEHVADGDLSQEEADARLAEITTRITEMVNEGGGMRGFGKDRPGSDADDTTGTTGSTESTDTTSA